MSGPDWFEREEDRLTDDYNNGVISRGEYEVEVRALRAELREQAEEAAQRAYDAGLGWY